MFEIFTRDRITMNHFFMLIELFNRISLKSTIYFE
jgi:hypothetical protein